MGIVSKIKEALKRAQGDVDQVQSKVSYWQGIVDAKRAELAELEASAGQRILDDESDTALRDYGVAKLNLSAAIEGAQEAARVAEGRLQVAQWALASEQATELREKAAALRAEAEQRQSRVEEMVAELVAFEGGVWRPWEPDSQDIAQAGAAGIAWSSPRTPLLFAEANELDRRAATLQERVSAERSQADVIIPHARIVWPGQHDRGHLVNLAAEVDVNDGLGSVTFEVVKNGLIVEAFTLPDGARRGIRKLVDGFHGDTVEVRADGRVLVSETFEVPAGEVNDGRGRPLIAGHAS